MSGLEETIQIMEEGMKKMTNGLDVLNKTYYQDIVKEEQLDTNYLLTEEQQNKMKGREIKQHYQGVYDKYEKKMNQLENEKKGLEQIFSSLEKAKRKMENMLSIKDSIKEAYDVNINNIKITINKVIKMINRNRYKTEAKMSKISLSFNEHINPRSKKEEGERKKKEEEERAARLAAEQAEAEKKEKEELEKKIKELEIKVKLNNRGNNEYVYNNLKTLEEWSGYQVDTVLYDSNIDGKYSSIFRNKILHHNQLYFIVIDSNDNVFGHYHSGVIDEIDGYNYDSNMFIFTLNNNGRCGIKKFNNKKGNNAYTYIYSDYRYYFCYDYYIYQIDTNSSYISKSIGDYFSGIEKTILTGNKSYFTDYFTTKRIIVIQMK